MDKKDTISEEIIIVGSRYGELADVLNPLYKEEKPIEEEEIQKMLGGDMVLFHPTHNTYDQYAVWVYTLSQKLLGYVWMYQSPSIRDWLDDNHKEYLKAHIRQVNTKYGFMMATPDKPVKLKYRERTSFSIDPDWASNIPEVLPSITEQSLCLGIALLRDELEEAETWSEMLQKRINNLLRNLPLDLSAHRYMESMELYEMMRNSPIAQVREQSTLVLQSLVKRGSKEQMTWWVKHWLPDFFRDAADGDLLGIYEAANYTLERVEGLLNGSPENLFYLFKVNRERFAYHLYYSQLPQPVYNRLLTLLAVREVMKKSKGERDMDDMGASCQQKWSKLPKPKRMAEVVEETMAEALWYGSTGWAVVYRVYQRAGFNGSYSEFVREARDWPWSRKINYLPTDDAVGKPLRDGKMLAEIEDWEDEGVPKRNRLLAYALMKKLGLD